MDAYLAKANAQQKLRDASGYDPKIYRDRFEDLCPITYCKSITQEV